MGLINWTVDKGKTNYKVAVFSLDPLAASKIWNLEGTLAKPNQADPGFAATEKLKVFKFVENDEEIVHLYVSR